MLDRDHILKLVPDLVRIRRDLHAHPELRHEEKRTSALVAQLLRDWGLEVHEGIGGYGVVGTLKRGASERSVALRADMDALPIHELNTFDHASTYPGKMHACGHDGHTTMLLGAARYLAERGGFDGTVVLVFQPAEEGGGGARLMVEDGLFERFPVEAIFGLHNWPDLPAGSFGVREGPIMASSNPFELHIKGIGSHAAQPHRSVDPVLAAVQLVQAWQTVSSRNVSPIESAVLSVTQINAGSAVNVIPEDVTLKGTVRTFSGEVLDLVERRMREIAAGIGVAFGAELHLDFRRVYPAVVNCEAETALVVEVMRSLVARGRVNGKVEPSMASEDFSFFLQRKPGCYAFIGNGSASPASNHPHHLHSATYDFNDEILPLGVSYWAALAQAKLPVSSC